MPEYEFSVYRIFPYKDVIVDSVLIEGKCGSEKTCTLSYFTQWNLNRIHQKFEYVVIRISDLNNENSMIFFQHFLTFSSGDFEVDETTWGDVSVFFLCCAMFLNKGWYS